KATAAAAPGAKHEHADSGSSGSRERVSQGEKHYSESIEVQGQRQAQGLAGENLGAYPHFFQSSGVYVFDAKYRPSDLSRHLHFILGQRSRIYLVASLIFFSGRVFWC